MQIFMIMIIGLWSCLSCKSLSSESETKIINGEILYDSSPENHDKFKAVLKFTSSDHKLCTGTLLSPHVVLTAAHCVLGKDMKVSQLHFRHKISQVAFINPAFRPQDTAEERAKHDFALVYFEENFIPSSDAIHLPQCTYQPIHTNQPVTLIGYGEFRPGIGSGIRRYGYNHIESYTDYIITLSTTPGSRTAVGGRGDSGAPLFNKDFQILAINANGDQKGKALTTRYMRVCSPSFKEALQQAYTIPYFKGLKICPLEE